MKSWTDKDANARFSEMLNTCLKDGPQIVTHRGVEVAVLVPADAWRRLNQAARPGLKNLLLTDENRGDLALVARGSQRRRLFTTPPA